MFLMVRADDLYFYQGGLRMSSYVGPCVTSHVQRVHAIGDNREAQLQILGGDPVGRHVAGSSNAGAKDAGTAACLFTVSILR